MLFLNILFSYTDSATTGIYTLSLHDALPISGTCGKFECCRQLPVRHKKDAKRKNGGLHRLDLRADKGVRERSEEHTSELQSRRDLVCRLLLEKKNVKGDDSHLVHDRAARVKP